MPIITDIVEIVDVTRGESELCLRREREGRELVRQGEKGGSSGAPGADHGDDE